MGRLRAGNSQASCLHAQFRGRLFNGSGRCSHFPRKNHHNLLDRLRSSQRFGSQPNQRPFVNGFPGFFNPNSFTQRHSNQTSFFSKKSAAHAFSSSTPTIRNGWTTLKSITGRLWKWPTPTVRLPQALWTLSQT